MPERVMPGPVEGSGGFRGALRVLHPNPSQPSPDMDCIEDLRFYPKLQYVDVINHALSVKGGSADLLYVYADVKPVNFNRGPRRRCLPRFSPYGSLRIDWIEGNFLRYIV